MASAYTERQRKVTVIFIDSIAVSGVGRILISSTHLGKDRFLFL